MGRESIAANSAEERGILVYSVSVNPIIESVSMENRRVSAKTAKEAGT